MEEVGDGKDDGYPLVSVIIPARNVVTVVEECLQSVLSQSYRGVIETIVVDDSSTVSREDEIMRSRGY